MTGSTGDAEVLVGGAALGDTALGGTALGSAASIERFDAYMERCLYGPNGFYATTGTAGRKGGDFITSPEVGPLFGAVLAEALDEWWTTLGKPDPFRIFDVGCGPGKLLKSIAIAKPDRPWELIGVDRVDSPGAQLTELPQDLSGSIVIANELLDNLPFRILHHDQDQLETGLREVYISEAQDGTRHEVLLETDAALATDTALAIDLESAIAPGQRAPLLETATQWVSSVLERGPAVLCLFDYGERSTAELAARGGWIRTYRDHQRGSDPLAEPGGSDITTDIAWDQFPTPDTLERQHEALTRWGIEALVEQGRDHWKANAHAPDLTAIRMRSRISESEALVDLSGLGNWWVASWWNA